VKYRKDANGRRRRTIVMYHNNGSLVIVPYEPSIYQATWSVGWSPEKTKIAALSLAEEAALHIVNVVRNNKPLCWCSFFTYTFG